LKTVNFLGKRVPVPGNVVLRVLLGLVMILGGILGFLPIVGYWMLPLGLLILSIDFPWVRRLRRNLTVRLGAWFKRRWPNAARRIGMTFRRHNREAA
jgi:purine-cytosine permease-like protein